jgi:membrane-associated protease RseP (regulator of RpoE activity)
LSIANITDFISAMDKVRPDSNVSLITKAGQSYSIKAVKNPSNESMGFIGVTGFEQDRMPKNDTLFNQYLLKFLLWIFELLWWTQFISLNIGLINLFPIFITDGARILKTNIDVFIHDKKKAIAVFNAINLLGLFVIGILILLPLARNLFNVFLSFIVSFIK